MDNQFKSFLEKNIGIRLTDSMLLAVSGGIDSMVMLHLFAQSGISVSIAHCNFQLRGEDSKGDEQLVINTAKKYGITCHSIHFDTQEYAQQKGLSIQIDRKSVV